MNIPIIFFGEVKDGVLKMKNRKGFDTDLKSLEGMQVEGTIRKKRKGRSSAQNRYFHGVIVPIVKEALLESGIIEARSNEFVKDFIKYNCLVKEFTNEETGETFKTIGKTSDLSASEFADMVADIQRWASENLNCYIPDPGEQMEIDLKNEMNTINN